jgi:hypothetical protein
MIAGPEGGPSPMHEALRRPAGLTLVPLHIG